MSGNDVKSKASTPTRVDPRVIETRDLLGDALVQLMRERAFDDITVQHVLDRAGVGRSTFYTHYRDKQDLFLSDAEDFFAMMGGYLSKINAPAERIVPVRELFAHLRDFRDFHASLVASGKAAEVMQLGRGCFARSIEQRLAPAQTHLSTLDRKAIAHALSGSLFSLLEWWIDGGMRVEPAAMDELFHRMARHGAGQR